MIVLSLILLLVLVFLVVIRSRHIKIKRKVLTPQECSHIINISNKYTYEQFTEEVDLRPAYEIDIYDVEKEGVILNEELWNICKNIYNVHLKSKFQMPGYVFLRRYTHNERVDLPIHIDSNKTTVLFLLSDTREFEGGGLYIFDKRFSEKHKYIGNKPTHIKNDFVNNIKHPPIVDLGQGDSVTYSGEEHLHGVLPVTKGVRYTLSFFFD